MAYKIVFFDVDGTLTNHQDGSISTKTKEAIHALKEKGMKVVAATGRPLSMCQDIKYLGIDTFITANGGYAKHESQVIHKMAMDQRNVQDIFEFAKAENHGLSFYTEEFYMNGVKNPQILKALKETLFLQEYPTIDELIYRQDVYLMCLYASDQMVKKYSSHFPHLTFLRWHPFVLNVLQEEVSKSVAIRKVLEYFDIDKSEAIAFGDGENDIDMLEFVGLGVAMGNGNERVQSAADFVTKKSSEEGIEFALNEIGLL